MYKFIGISILIIIITAVIQNNDRDLRFYNTQEIIAVHEEVILSLGGDSTKYLGDRTFRVTGHGKTCIVTDIGFKKHPDQDIQILDDKSFNKIEQCFNN